MLQCFSSMHKHIHRKIPRKKNRESVNEKGKNQLKPNRVKNLCFDFLKQRFIQFWWMSFIFGLFFFLHFTKIKIHYTLVHLIICTRFFYLMNTQFQSQMTCFQFNFHLFEMTSKYVEHQLHDYNILLNASNFRMVFLGLRVRYTIDISIKSCWTNQNKKKCHNNNFIIADWIRPSASVTATFKYCFICAQENKNGS